MRKAIKTHKKKLQYAAPVFIVGALSFAVLGFGGNPNNLLNNEPFIQDLEPFVLVADNSIHLSDSTQTSSGDIASNKSVHIAENGIINSNLFSNRIQLADNSSISGNTTSNKLIKAETAEIFGEQTDTISLPVIELPQVPNFQTGTLSHTVEEDTTLNPGNFNTIEVKEGTVLTLTPGTYNLNTLTLRDNSKLLYSEATTINVKSQLKVQNNTLVASNSATSTSTTDLQMNYTGKPPVIMGDNSFITAKILSPTSRVQIGNNTTYLGQMFAKNINVGEEGVLSRGLGTIKETDPEKVIVDEDGSVYPLNEIIVNFTDEATFLDAQEIAELVDGQIVGYMQFANAYQIEVIAENPEELKNKIELIESTNNPLVEGIFENFSLRLE